MRIISIVEDQEPVESLKVERVINKILDYLRFPFSFSLWMGSDYKPLQINPIFLSAIPMEGKQKGPFAYFRF